MASRMPKPKRLVKRQEAEEPDEIESSEHDTDAIESDDDAVPPPPVLKKQTSKGGKAKQRPVKGAGAPAKKSQQAYTAVSSSEGEEVDEDDEGDEGMAPKLAKGKPAKGTGTTAKRPAVDAGKKGNTKKAKKGAGKDVEELGPVGNEPADEEEEEGEDVEGEDDEDDEGEDEPITVLEFTMRAKSSTKKWTDAIPIVIAPPRINDMLRDCQIHQNVMYTYNTEPLPRVTYTISGAELSNGLLPPPNSDISVTKNQVLASGTLLVEAI